MATPDRVETSAQAAEERLDELFRCEHLGKTLARKHCLRRQLERGQVKHPRTSKLMAGEPVNGHCATACQQGREVKASLAGIPAGFCPRCGTARIGATAMAGPCEECDAAEMETGKKPPRGFLVPVVEGTPDQARIWAKDAPDAPIAPPARQDVGLTTDQVADAAARVRAAMKRPTRVATPPPAEAVTEQKQASIEVEEHATPPAPPPLAEEDVIAALRALGFKAFDAVRAAGNCRGETLEERVKDALRMLRPATPAASPPLAPDGLRGGTRGSKARLEVPRLSPAMNAVMTDRRCKCGCGRQLRKNNTTGWSGYCNPARYANGERPSRSKTPAPVAPANTEPPAPPAEETTMPCPECKSPTRHKSGCSKAPKAAPAAKVKAAPPAKKAPLSVAEVHERRAAEIAARAAKKKPQAKPMEAAQVLPTEHLSDEDLARSIAACRAELERRQGEVAERGKRLAEVIASISAAA